TSYTATITTGGKDLSGNTLAANYTWSFATVAGPSCPCSAWGSAAAPSNPSVNDPNAVELGVKFKLDLNGFITGIRFYKGATNTGTHTGTLWSSSGQQLATATFSGETASGWQQVNFVSPVAVTANTVYVASYHTNVGNYAGDNGYFAISGVDSPPVHLLRDGVSGGNGVYAYSASSTFPANTYQSSNYWVDVVFSSGTAPTATLTSIAVTPANPTIQSGATQQFTATGTYSDNSSQNLTSQVTWASSNTAVATISSTGLATSVKAGSTSISAAQGGVTGSTTLTVQAAPLAITTTSLPSGTVGASYSATLTATGGTSPYTWSISSGSLPIGLTLNATTGGISGTPSTAGTVNFTVQAADSATPQATTSKALSIVINAAGTTTSTIWASTAAPAIADAGPDSSVELGVKFRADSNGTITGIRFYKASTNTGTHTATLWSSSGQQLATATFSGETASGWQQVNFATPVAVTANTIYVASYHATVGHYADDENYFATSGVDNPPLHALQNGVSGFNGVYAYGTGTIFPTQGFNSSNYWVDVVFQH
ncbi:MAG TPA: DUF4082 domain-containing protein, partial [Bryobacteraceae bacterium]